MITYKKQYFSRKVDHQLIAWKEDEGHKPLLLRGARQVGNHCRPTSWK